MQIFLAIVLIAIAVVLFLSKRLIENDDLERAANAGGVVATIAAVIVLAFYTTSITPQTTSPTIVNNSTETFLSPEVLPSHSETPTIDLLNTFTSTATSIQTQTQTQTYTPTLTSTSTATRVLPFLDNFDKGIDLNIWEMLSGEWRTIDGRLVADPSRNPSKITMGDKDWKNYVVEVDVYAMSAAGFPVGIIVRSSNGKSLMFRTDCCDTDWILINGVSEQIIAHVDQGGLEFKLRAYVKSHIRVEVIDQTFTGYIDGKQFLQVTDSTSPTGAVGLMSQTPHQNRLVFDDFSVSSP